MKEPIITPVATLVEEQVKRVQIPYNLYPGDTFVANLEGMINQVT